jgi:vancomycin permeability regulator SanA
MKKVVLVVVVVLLLLAAYPAWLGYQIWEQSRQDELPAGADAIVVLGAAHYNGRPSPVLKARLDHAAYLYGEGFSHTVIVTGGRAKGDEISEAEAAERYLGNQRAVPPEDVLAEVEGKTTL